MYLKLLAVSVELALHISLHIRKAERPFLVVVPETVLWVYLEIVSIHYETWGKTLRRPVKRSHSVAVAVYVFTTEYCYCPAKANLQIGIDSYCIMEQKNNLSYRRILFHLFKTESSGGDV